MSYDLTKLIKLEGLQQLANRIKNLFYDKNEIDAKLGTIVPIEKGGTGNSNGYIRTGAFSQENCGKASTAEGGCSSPEQWLEENSNDIFEISNFSGSDSNYTFTSSISDNDRGFYIMNSTFSKIGEIKTSSHDGNNWSIVTHEDMGEINNENGYISWVWPPFTHVSGDYSHAEGYGNFVYGDNSHAEGSNNITIEDSSHLEGKKNYSNGECSHIEGEQNKNYGYQCHIEGMGNTATDSVEVSHIEGLQNRLTQAGCAHVEGSYNEASGANTHAEGTNVNTIGDNSHAEGNGTKTWGQDSHAEGKYSYAFGEASHAEGFGTDTPSILDTNIKISGNANTATYNYTGTFNPVQGDRIYYFVLNSVNYIATLISYTQNTITFNQTLSNSKLTNVELKYVNLSTSSAAMGRGSHAEGKDTIAVSAYSHAEGQNSIAAYGVSHAEGENTFASGNHSSHAEGYNTKASGAYGSHAEGNYTIAAGGSQHVVGKYNIADAPSQSYSPNGQYVEIVGNGTSDNNRSNARTLDWNGNEILAGKLTVGSGPIQNMDVATKQYVDELGVRTADLVQASEQMNAEQKFNFLSNLGACDSLYPNVVSPLLLRISNINMDGLLLSCIPDEDDENHPVLYLAGNNYGEDCRIGNIRKPLYPGEACPKEYVDPINVIFSGTSDGGDCACTHTFAQIKTLIDAKRNVKFFYKISYPDLSYSLYETPQIRYFYDNNTLSFIEANFTASTAIPTDITKFTTIICSISDSETVYCEENGAI